MEKKGFGFFILLFVLLSSLELGLVGAVVNVWNATLNGPRNGIDLGFAVAVDNSSNVYVTGTSNWSGTYDIYLGKFNSSGSNMWNITINGPQNLDDDGYGIAIDNDLNIYLTGQIYWSSNTYRDLYLGKFNSSGSNLWNTTFRVSGSSDDVGNGIAIYNNSDIYVTGESYNDVTSTDIYLGKFNSSGSSLWNVTIDGPQDSDDGGYGVAVGNDSNIYITGYSFWSSATGEDLYLGKFNSSGSNLWNATITSALGEGYSVEGWGVALDSSSNIYVTGRASWTPATSGFDIYLGKFNSSGSNLWNSTINGNNSNDEGHALAVDINSRIYVAGFSRWSSNDTYDIYLGQFNSSGSNLWNFTVNGPGSTNDWGRGVALDPNNNSNIYVAGAGNWSGTNDIYLGRFYEPPCAESWSCTDWSDCSSSTQTRTCTDANVCGTTKTKPAETQGCTMPGSVVVGGGGGGGGSSCSTNWVCSAWGLCIFGNQTRNCTKERISCSAGTKPSEKQACVESGNTQNLTTCNPGEKRCAGNVIELCQGNKTWTAGETCSNGCENGRCLKAGTSSIIFYSAAAVVGGSAVFISYLLLRKIVLKRKRR